MSSSRVIINFYIKCLSLEVSRLCSFSVEVLPKDRTLASSHSVKPKDDVIQQVPDPKGKDKGVDEYADRKSVV